MYLRVIRNRGRRKNKHIVRMWIVIIGLIVIKIVTNICFKMDKVVNYKNIVAKKCEEVLLDKYKDKITYNSEDNPYILEFF